MAVTISVTLLFQTKGQQEQEQQSVEPEAILLKTKFSRPHLMTGKTVLNSVNNCLAFHCTYSIHSHNDISPPPKAL